VVNCSEPAHIIVYNRSAYCSAHGHCSERYELFDFESLRSAAQFADSLGRQDQSRCS
jgi:hypothetical protein